MKRCSVIVGIFVIVGFVLDGSICDGSKKYNRYLAHIFNKYGSGGTMSFEGLEHLMHSLGLGGLEFNPTHTIEEHHPDGYKIPDVTLDEDIQQNKDLQTIESINQHVEVKELEQENRDKAGKTLQDPSEIADDDDDGNILPLQSDELGFKEMHDPKHRHPRHHADPVSSNNCLSPQSLLKLVIDNDGAENINKNNYMINTRQDRSKRYANEQPRTDEEEYNEIVNNIKITPITFLKMCPALLVQIDQDACAQPIISEHHDINVQGYGYAWIYASIAIFIISCCGLLGVAIVPLAKSVAYDEILKFLVAIAVGTLCGDALMHLMPHALIKEHDNASTSSVPEGHNNEPVWLCACAFLTALFMYSLETLLPLIKGENGHNHGHSHHHGKKDNPTSIDMEIIPKQLDAKEINIMLNETETDKKSVALSPVAFMVILGDGLHNITDGLAIGAAFAGDPVTGMATAFAVLCHELPHELGDFALLLQTGVHIKRALFLNIVSSILSFMGMAAGLIVAGVHTDMVRWIYAGTAGSFLYIALADLIPEMGRDSKRSLKNCLIQISGILLGGVIMMLIALNEENLRILFE